MAEIVNPNLFTDQTANANSLEANVEKSDSVLYVEGVFDGAIIEIENTLFNESWIKETTGDGTIIQITSAKCLVFDSLPRGAKLRLNLTNAGASTNITAGVY